MNRRSWIASLLVGLARGPTAAWAQAPHPFVDRVVPREGPPGTLVTITGGSFVRGVAVYLGEVIIPIVRRSPGRLVVRIPVGARDGTLLVTIGDEEESAGAFRVTASSPDGGHP